MEQYFKEFYISRIITGSFRCKINEKYYIIKQPDRNIRHIAQQIFIDALKDAELDNLYNNKELHDFLLDNELWSDKKEENLKQIQQDLDELKVQLYQSAFKSEERKKIRKMINVAKIEITSLYQQKTAYDHLSCEGFASTMKMRYLVGKSLMHENNTPVWEEDDFWKNTDPILEEATSVYIENKISDKDFRELARTDPWRSIWSSRKSEGSLFGVPAVDLTEEQKNLIIWSSLYDNINEHPNCPSDEVINDDDMIDGWLILQRRERQKNKAKVDIEDFVSNDRIKNSGEIFVIAQTQEDAKRVDSLNDDTARAIKKQRIELIKQKGTVNEVDMPDTKMQIQMQANRGGK